MVSPDTMVGQAEPGRPTPRSILPFFPSWASLVEPGGSWELGTPICLGQPGAWWLPFYKNSCYLGGATTSSEARLQTVSWVLSSHDLSRNDALLCREDLGVGRVWGAARFSHFPKAFPPELLGWNWGCYTWQVEVSRHIQRPPAQAGGFQKGLWEARRLSHMASSLSRWHSCLEKSQE